MKAVVKSSSSAIWEVPPRAWSLGLPFAAVSGVVLGSAPHAAWLRDLVIADGAAALGFAYWDWARRWRQEPNEAGVADHGAARDEAAITRGALALAFEDRIDAAIAHAARAGRQAGLISLWWIPSADVDATPDISPLRALLAGELESGSVLHFVDDDRAWVLVDKLHAYEDLQALQERLVQALVRQTGTPLRTVASGCALAPLHGTEARDLIEFADAHQAHQIRIHPMQSYARGRPTLVALEHTSEKRAV